MKKKLKIKNKKNKKTIKKTIRSLKAAVKSVKKKIFTKTKKTSLPKKKKQKILKTVKPTKNKVQISTATKKAKLNKQKDKLKKLITKGKDQGYLTFTEVNDNLPPEIVDPEQIEDIIGMLNEDMGIPIYDEMPENEAPLLPNENAPVVAKETSAAPAVTTEDETGRTSDPVRMYMREMGTVELLTRGGEITIAKKIETGSKHVLSALAQYPGIVDSILAEYTKTENSDKRIQDIISGFYDIEEWNNAPDKQKIANLENLEEGDNINHLAEESIAALPLKKKPTIEDDDDKAATQDEAVAADEENTTDDDELDIFESGPDPIIAKERFTKLRELNRQYTKALDKHGKKHKKTIKLQQQLIDAFTQFKLTPKEFHKQI
jgi:RNA polymerase primary sigma factor